MQVLNIPAELTKSSYVNLLPNTILFAFISSDQKRFQILCKVYRYSATRVVLLGSELMFCHGGHAS